MSRVIYRFLYLLLNCLIPFTPPYPLWNMETTLVYSTKSIVIVIVTIFSLHCKLFAIYV